METYKPKQTRKPPPKDGDSNSNRKLKLPWKQRVRRIICHPLLMDGKVSEVTLRTFKSQLLPILNAFLFKLPDEGYPLVIHCISLQCYHHKKTIIAQEECSLSFIVPPGNTTETRKCKMRILQKAALDLHISLDKEKLCRLHSCKDQPPSLGWEQSGAWV